jgi:DNA polymerase I
VWLRRLIKPGPGMSVVYLDWSAQEIAIAAALSGDHFLAESIASGDPYMHFVVLAGMVPEGATKETHQQERALCKATMLGTQYGMGSRSLAFRTKKKIIEAEAMLETLARTYPIFAKWREAEVDTAFLRGYATTNYGWTLHVSERTKPTALKNFPMQSHGAEMLRIALCLTTVRDVTVIAPVHDAIMIECPTEVLDDTVKVARGAMAEAAAAVIGPGVWIDTSVKITSYPDRYQDADGRDTDMWNRVTRLLKELDKVSDHTTNEANLSSY